MNDLQQTRQRAAHLSRGISATPILDLVLRLVQQLDLQGAVLDFGAGRGHLLRQLQSLSRFPSLTGADLLPRPAGLDAAIQWLEQDLNEPLPLASQFDVVISTEVIEHLENPRQTFRHFAALLKPGGTLILTTPNQESVRSFLALLFGGHFAAFLGASYPVHITALLRLDLERIARETGFDPPRFYYSNHGGLPKRPAVTWQRLSFGLLRGRWFSDNLALVTRRLADRQGGA